MDITMDTARILEPGGGGKGLHTNETDFLIRRNRQSQITLIKLAVLLHRGYNVTIVEVLEVNTVSRLITVFTFASCRYRERSKELSLLFRLDPIPPLEKAVYYTEQLMKVGNFKHLRPSSVNLSWYQYLLFDVLAIIALVIFVTGKVIRWILSSCISLCCKSSKRKKD